MKKLELKQILKEEIRKVLKETLSKDDFPKLKAYLESLIPSNMSVEIVFPFPPNLKTALLIAYFPKGSSPDASKVLPRSIVEKILDRLAGVSYRVNVVTDVERTDPVSGKKKNYVGLVCSRERELKALDRWFWTAGSGKR